MTVRARFENRSCYLSNDFGAALACRKLNISEDELEEIVGRYSRGKRKGKLRGLLVWRKCVSGGWVRTGGAYEGYVESPRKTMDYKILDAWTKEPISVMDHKLKKLGYTWNQRLGCMSLASKES